ncbi:protein-serine O-palmitoleoyltransferase porcupine-like [Physella acuta]|uniref:protein-serine O-palmitoleoyltransferase porcupine-like n=1 Tax=Physella acuta TaxID=109671 RepID=UPI0027DBA2C4|nr:protein-serine O-palmitoleoyltransferase porcupine-like [Physella acuta]XP_059171794.1 protein-serine O-palmitoleoyltransferase porcupine-like [Physella acuta]XP_059171795.1 protein-serine O-palmitoleoyltransferase porcupine-like [Physella acuta]XP_059171796.1 protein-serine O-palmitoleoyltransferase porcupine-like [Physella acuta]
MDDFYDDYMDPDMMSNDFSDLSQEELLELIASQGGQLTPEMMEYLQAHHRHGKITPGVQERLPVSEVFQNCLIPTWTQATDMLLSLFIFCIVFRTICQVNHIGLKFLTVPQWVIHACSAILGILALKSFLSMDLLYLVTCCLLSYLVLMFVHKWNRSLCGIAALVFIVTFSLICELLIVKPTLWHKIRGAHIILSMKIISLGVDIGEEGSVLNLPNIVEYMGYCFNVGTVVFGPWVSYRQYCQLLDKESNPLSFTWAIKVLITSSLAMVSLIYSNCFTTWIILDDAWRWLLAYRDAQAFRFSHYFISFLSDATSSLTGIADKEESALQWNVVRPHNIEIPRSMVEVVTNWNLPMHYWLKTYVFKRVRPYGTFLAITLTYVASSLLHGLNFQLAAVLLSLGFYTYTEFVLRRRLSQIFDACIQARKCKEKCEHKYTSKNPLVILTNLCLGALAVFHLAYLGLMFNNSDDQDVGYTMSHTLEKWSSLQFLSHWVALGTFIFYWLI